MNERKQLKKALNKAALCFGYFSRIWCVIINCFVGFSLLFYMLSFQLLSAFVGFVIFCFALRALKRKWARLLFN